MRGHGQPLARTSRDQPQQMFHGAQKQRALCQALEFVRIEQSSLAQQLQPIPQISRQPELMAGLQRTSQVVEVVGPARTGFQVRSSFTALKFYADVTQFRVEVWPLRNLGNALSDSLLRLICNFGIARNMPQLQIGQRLPGFGFVFEVRRQLRWGNNQLAFTTARTQPGVHRKYSPV